MQARVWTWGEKLIHGNNNKLKHFQWYNEHIVKQRITSRYSRSYYVASIIISTATTCISQLVDKLNIVYVDYA